MYRHSCINGFKYLGYLHYNFNILKIINYFNILKIIFFFAFLFINNFDLNNLETITQLDWSFDQSILIHEDADSLNIYEDLLFDPVRDAAARNESGSNSQGGDSQGGPSNPQGDGYQEGPSINSTESKTETGRLYDFLSPHKGGIVKNSGIKLRTRYNLSSTQNYYSRIYAHVRNENVISSQVRKSGIHATITDDLLDKIKNLNKNYPKEYPNPRKK